MEVEKRMGGPLEKEIGGLCVCVVGCVKGREK